MNISSLTSLFKRKKQKILVPDTILVKRLENLAHQSDLLVFKNVNIYHHSSTHTIPLLVLDRRRGLYLFETREWTFDELKNATIEKAHNQDASDKTLAFDKNQNIIRQKFNELTHTDGIPIFNYLLMENLKLEEYEELDDSFKELLPLDKIIFSDFEETDILHKMETATAPEDRLCTNDAILSTLLIQYAIFDINSKMHLCTKEQMSFIDSELKSITNIEGVGASGKSSVLLLKSIVELFTNPNVKIIIIKPTILACDIFKKKLLELVEHAIIEVDLTSIEILTPLELLNKHQSKIGRERLDSIIIDDKLMKKTFNIADILMCDDAILYENNFIDYLKHIQKNSKLVVVNNSDTSDFNFHSNFKEMNKETYFYQTTPHAKALQLIAKLLEEDSKILLVSNSISSQKLQDDLFKFIETKPHTLNSSTQLINQESHKLTFCGYQDTNEFQTNHIILMDLCFSSINEIEYALNLSDQSVHILYEEDCQEIKQLRTKYEKSTQEHS